MDTEPGQHYKIKLRLYNKLYTTILQGFQIDDLNNRGERSSVVQMLKDDDISGCATGTFPYPMEILYVEGVNQQESMDIEVSICYLLFKAI